MAISYSIKAFGPEIVEAYQRLFLNPADDQDVARLVWRFEQGPHGPGLFAVARDNEARNQIIGMIALLATRIRIGASTSLAYQAIDTVVDPVYRDRRVFVSLGRVAQDGALHQGEVLWGFPNPNAAPGWFGRLGWKDFGTVPFLFRPLRTGFFLRKLHSSLGNIDIRMVRQKRISGAHKLIE